MKLEEYRAGLIEYRHDGACSYRLIDYAPNCNHLIKTVSESVNDSTKLLIEDHWEHMIDLDFDVRYDQTPADRWRQEEVIDHLTALSNQLIADFQFDSVDRIKHTEWYTFVKLINDCLPDKNYIRVPVEGNLIDFSRSMLQREVGFYRPLGQITLSTWEAQFLGELSVLAARETFDEKIWRSREREYIQFFHRVIQRFNDQYVS